MRMPSAGLVKLQLQFFYNRPWSGAIPNFAFTLRYDSTNGWLGHRFPYAQRST